MPLTLSCLSFNIWDLPLWLPKLNNEKRVAQMPQAMGALLPDVICLQESFRCAHRRELLAALPQGYHLAGSLKNRWMLPLLRADRTGGLAILSRLPLAAYRFVEHARSWRMRFDERLGRKGFALAQIMTAVGAVFIVNAHLYAGRSPRETEIRMQQLDTLFSSLQEYCPAGTPVILAGDFNASPTTHFPTNTRYEPTPEYERILAEGFVDTLPTFGLEHITYTGRENVYAKMLIDPASIPQKLDYVFYRPGASMSFETMEARVVFNRPEFLSDHNGVFCKLKVHAHRDVVRAA